MSSQPSTATPRSLGDTLGALYIGSTIAAMYMIFLTRKDACSLIHFGSLFGITNLQTVIYYKKYPHDWWLFRYSVALLWVLDALHVALSTHALYVYLIDMFGDLAGVLVHSVWSFKVQMGINIIIVIFVQELYAIRLWKFGRHFHKNLSLFVFFAVAASLGAGLCKRVIHSFSHSNRANKTISVIIYGIYITPNFSAISDMRTAIYIFFAMATAADFAIAPMMWYYLHKIRVATDFSTTASLLLGLMRLVVVSGLAISACSLLALISYVAWPETLIFLGVDFIIPKLYINSLLARLNYRREHAESNNSNAERGELLTLAVLQITTHASEDTIAGANTSVPLSESLFEDKADHSNGALNHNHV
ncbi:hypothetical protein ARMSODRAFT_1088807 [Armillaria solidipes]|uniref:DUF6534 domain-containing protein n=1 Tax=Armillaria solidipes TaxID=1076256 RepID=A0A2H3BEK5_9AGAR|nr:hypothetical protein ARMSODRAFT_1088807 [Armillaria solidipes]